MTPALRLSGTLTSRPSFSFSRVFFFSFSCSSFSRILFHSFSLSSFARVFFFSLSLSSWSCRTLSSLFSLSFPLAFCSSRPFLRSLDGDLGRGRGLDLDLDLDLDLSLDRDLDLDLTPRFCVLKCRILLDRDLDLDLGLGPRPCDRRPRPLDRDLDMDLDLDLDLAPRSRDLPLRILRESLRTLAARFASNDLLREREVFRFDFLFVASRLVSFSFAAGFFRVGTITWPTFFDFSITADRSLAAAIERRLGSLMGELGGN